MPREMSTRRFGIEMEGYFQNHPREIKIKGGHIKRDGSLTNAYWGNHSEKYGVEINSRPIKTLDIVGRIFGEMEEKGIWSVDDRAGTHIHVEIKDYTELDKIKLIRFCKGIENIMYTLVKDYRYSNSYCRKMENDWRKVFKETDLADLLKGAGNNQGLRIVREEFQKKKINNVYNSKYYWCHVYGSSRPTAEFRLFHAIENAEEAKNFVRLAVAIVDLCKVVTPEQLEYIIAMIYKDSKDTDDCIKKLYEAVGLDFERYGAKKRGEQAIEYLNGRLDGTIVKKKKKRAVVAGDTVDTFNSEF